VSLQVSTVPTVRTFVATTANFTVLENQGTGYRGLVNISALDKNGTRLAGQRYSSIPGKEGYLDLTLTQPGDISVHTILPACHVRTPHDTCTRTTHTNTSRTVQFCQHRGQ